jgi:hypothetical protein
VSNVLLFVGYDINDFGHGYGNIDGADMASVCF